MVTFKKTVLALSATMGLSLLSFSALGSDLYVNPEEGGSFSGEGVYTSLNDAVTAAKAGDVIHLQNGYYPLTAQVALDKAVSIVSDGDRDKTIVYASSEMTTQLFKMTSSGAVVSNLYIYGKSPSGEQTSNGGAVYITGGTVVDSVISSHEYGYRIGAIKFNGSGRGAGLVDRCIITNNVSTSECGAVFIQAGTLRNSLIAYNSANGNGSALFCFLSSCNVHNNTFVCNTNLVKSGEMTIRYNGNAPDFRGNICYDNRTGTGALDTNARTDIYLESRNLFNPDGDIFVDAAGGDFHLNSEYSDMTLIEDRFATSEYEATFPFGSLDLDRKERAVKDMVDMGCYELQLAALSCWTGVSKNGTLDEDRVVLTANVYGNLEGTNCTWRIVNRSNSEWPAVTTTGSQVTGVYPIGIYDVTLTVENAAGDVAIEEASAAFTVLPKIVYVHPDGDGMAPFNSFEKAVPDLDLVLSEVLDGQVIYLNSGNYALKGEKKISKQITIESLGDAESTVVYSEKETQGTFLVFNKAGTVVRNLTISGKTPEGVQTSIYGGVSTSGSMVIEDCIITGHSGGRSYALSISGSTADRCQIISNNTCAVQIPSGIIRNSLIVGNYSGSESSVFFISSRGTIYNCTVALNRGATTIRQGTADNQPVFMGNIFYNNSNGSGGIDDYAKYYSHFGLLNEVINPDASVFMDVERNDFRLSEAAVEAGIVDRLETDRYVSSLGEKDLAGYGRVVNDRVDAGCYEKQVPIAVTMEPSCAGNLDVDTVTLSASLTGYDQAGVVYSWAVTEKSSGKVVTASGADKAVFTHDYPTGYYSVSLTVVNGNGESATKVYENAFTVMPRTVYVSATGSGTAPFDSVEKGINDLSVVLQSIQAGQTIYLGEGRYAVDKTIEMDKDYKIIGAGRKEETVIFAPEKLSARMVNVSHPYALLEGVTLLGTNGVGVVTTSGGVYMSAGTLRDCIVTGHSFGKAVGALFLKGACVVDRCIVTNNVSSDEAGGIYADVDSTLRAPKIMNSFIAYNTANGDGSAIYLFNAGVTIYNCTIAFNKTTASKGAGHTIRLNNNCPSMVGTVFYQNKHNDEIDTSYNSGWYGSNVFEPDASAFVDAAGGDFHLGAGAADAVMTNRFTLAQYRNGISEFDLDGNPRFAEGYADIGCYEMEGETISAAISMTRTGGTVGDAITFSAAVSGAGREGATYSWMVTNRVTGAVVLSESGIDQNNLKTTEIPYGYYAVSLTITPVNGEAITFYGPDFTVFSKNVYILPEGLSEGDESPYGENPPGMVLDTIAEVANDECGGVTICLANGWYPITASVSLLKDLTIKGIGEREKVCIYPKSGLNSSQYLFTLRNSGASIRSVTLTGLNAEGVREVEARAVSITAGAVQDCIITDFCGNGSGVGVYMNGGTLSKTTLKGMTTASGITGLALYIASAGADALVDGCIIEDNKIGTTSAITTSQGAGAAVYAGTVQRTLFRRNNAQYGSALYLGGAANVRSSVFDDNLASLDIGETVGAGSGTIVVDAEGAKVENCTVVNNRVRGTGYDAVAGVWVKKVSSLAINVINSIIIGNKSLDDDTEHNVRHSDGVGGGTEDRYNFSTCVITEGYGLNPVTTDGELLGRGSKPYAIPSKSNWRNAGITEEWMHNEADFYGNPRLEGRAVDIGAVECATPPGLFIIIR